jgi:hypothetical protein
MADVPHEGSEATPLGSAKGGPPQAEAATAERNPADASPVENPWPRLGRGFERALSLSRVVVVVPVIVLLLSALASFAYGTDVFVRSVAHVVDDPELTTHNLGFLLLLTDLFLIGAWWRRSASWSRRWSPKADWTRSTSASGWQW